MIILLIDENQDRLIAFQEAIKAIDPSFQFIPANGGAEALEMLNDILPDIIFLDTHLTKMNGLQCLTLIRKNPSSRNLPVILYSISSHEYQSYLSKQKFTYIIKQQSVHAIVNCLKSLLKILRNKSNKK